MYPGRNWYQVNGTHRVMAQVAHEVKVDILEPHGLEFEWRGLGVDRGPGQWNRPAFEHSLGWQQALCPGVQLVPETQHTLLRNIRASADGTEAVISWETCQGRHTVVLSELTDASFYYARLVAELNGNTHTHRTVSGSPTHTATYTLAIRISERYDLYT